MIDKRINNKYYARFLIKFILSCKFKLNLQQNNKRHVKEITFSLGYRFYNSDNVQTEFISYLLCIYVNLKIPYGCKKTKDMVEGTESG